MVIMEIPHENNSLDPSDDTEGAWIFLSHSHKDINNVRKVRNELESYGHNPLLFYLKCLDDDPETFELIKREIDARNWFLLCNTDNSKKSDWVQKEVNYIKNLPEKYYVDLDLDSPWDEQQKIIENLAKKVTIYIAFDRKDSLEIAKQIAKKLREFDYKVIFFDDFFVLGDKWEELIENAIIDASNNGFVLALLSPRSMRKESMVRNEILFSLNIRSPSRDNIIPIKVQPCLILLNSEIEISLNIRGKGFLDFTQDTLENNMKRLIVELKNKRFQ
jgi:hypothetical protein